MASRAEEERVQQAGAGCFWATFAGHISGSAQPAARAVNGDNGNSGSAGGGSFWNLFDQMDFAVPSQIDILLEQRDCSVEALLREEDVIQEMRARHRGLIARLSQPDAAAVLIDCITREPPANSEPQGQPFVAVQLLTCDVPELFEAWVSPDHPELLDRFWGYLEETPRENTRWVLAGYFCTAGMVLLERYPDEVAAYLRRLGAEKVLDRLIARLDSRSIAELLACIAAAEWPSRIVFKPAMLVERLLRVLHNPSSSRDSQEHAQLIISELLARGGMLCFAEDLLSEMTSPRVVEPLLQQMITGAATGASAASAVLAATAFHTAGGGGAQLENGQSFSSLSPLGGLASRRGDDRDSLDNLANAAEDDFRELEDVRAGVSMRSIPASVVSGAVDMQCTQLVKSVCAQIAGIKGLLEVAATNSADSKGSATAKRAAPSGAPTSSIGATALANVLEVILVLTLLLKARRDEVLDAFQREDVLTICMRLLLRRPWCSLLHNAVASLFSEVLKVSDSLAVALVKSFVAKGGVLEMVVAEYRQKQRGHEPGRPGRCHAGYFGHLQNMVQEFEAFSDQHKASAGGRGQQLLTVEGWAEVVVPAVEATRKQHNEDLGGGIPPEVRALAASGLDSMSLGTPSAFGVGEASVADRQLASAEQARSGGAIAPAACGDIALAPGGAHAEKPGPPATKEAANAPSAVAAVSAGTHPVGHPPASDKSCCILL
mmetsp:Transcript_90097/g.259744  ORF Transcript_90097/g.259744 Transcript_90097/m.259744 type:complete len:718 (+) Transcript_90097:78-2231(+)|eukprot:CAMPEP_0176025076 /NCGR_PEP_ID=MMETSP0120_2-20121206/12262_1 /TAXON_ID=160619 /ORGANISM="Kryptoperidinium foliaceum, Strain CCMP 1326" /LENGTH=717 /DNA_ID=CAMNT_0017358257 /DNA_START=78 /DNA_END=2231 /DNA_ORIENTATION=-